MNAGDINRKAEMYVERTIKLLEEIKEKNKLDFKLLKAEYVEEDGTHYLRVYCDKDQPGGIGSDDCADIARPLSKALDKADFIEDDNYTLEVCSPGFMEPANETPSEDDGESEDSDK